VYRVLVNPSKGRVLVSGKTRDLELLSQGWVLEGEFPTWSAAFSYAKYIADKYDYVLEWYIEEMLSATTTTRSLRPVTCNCSLN